MTKVIVAEVGSCDTRLFQVASFVQNQVQKLLKPFAWESVPYIVQNNHVVNTPSAKAEGFSMDKLAPIPRTFTLSHTQCVARASRDWLPRLSIPRAKMFNSFGKRNLSQEVLSTTPNSLD